MAQQSLTVGDAAPDFQLLSAEGERFHLYEQLEKFAIVLFFYIGNFTPVCTAEACSFRDTADDFGTLDAAIYGISSGSAAITRRFGEHFKLPFPLLLDTNSQVRKLYGVPKMWGIFPGRSTYVVGRDKRVLQITRAGFDSKPHIVASLQVLRSGRGG